MVRVLLEVATLTRVGEAAFACVTLLASSSWDQHAVNVGVAILKVEAGAYRDGVFREAGRFDGHLAAGAGICTVDESDVFAVQGR